MPSGNFAELEDCHKHEKDVTKEVAAIVGIADKDAALVSMSFAIKSLTKLRAKSVAIKQKASEAFMSEHAAALGEITKAAIAAADKLLCIKVTAFWSSIQNCRVLRFLRDVLQQPTVEASMCDRVFDSLKSRAVVQSVLSPTKVGFANILEPGALKTADKHFARTDTFIQTMVEVVDGLEMEHETKMVRPSVFDPSWKQLFTVIAEAGWHQEDLLVSLNGNGELASSTRSAIRALNQAFGGFAIEELEEILTCYSWVSKVLRAKRRG